MILLSASGESAHAQAALRESVASPACKFVRVCLVETAAVASPIKINTVVFV